MIEGAKITMNYEDFKCIEQDLEYAKKEAEKYKKLFEEAVDDLESDKYVKALNDMERELSKSYKQERKTLATKQSCINKALDIYCKVFDIPSREELI